MPHSGPSIKFLSQIQKSIKKHLESNWSKTSMQNDEEKLSKKERAFLEFKTKGNEAVAAAQWSAAAGYYTEALVSAPSHYFAAGGQAVAVYSNRSFAYLKSGVLDKAMSDANECCKLRPDWSKSHFRKGEVFRHLGRWAEAAASFDAAVKCDPEDKVLFQYLIEAKEKAKLAGTAEEWIHPLEMQLGLSLDTVWVARGGLVGFIFCCLLASAQPKDLANPAAQLMLPIAGLGLGAAAGLAIRMIRAAKRREQLAPPDLPPSRDAKATAKGATRGGGGARGAAAAAPSAATQQDSDSDDGAPRGGADSKPAKRTSRIKGLSRSLRGRAGQ